MATREGTGKRPGMGENRVNKIKPTYHVCSLLTAKNRPSFGLLKAGVLCWLLAHIPLDPLGRTVGCADIPMVPLGRTVRDFIWGRPVIILQRR